jgi:hypothetical protein
VSSDWSTLQVDRCNSFLFFFFTIGIPDCDRPEQVELLLCSRKMETEERKAEARVGEVICVLRWRALVVSPVKAHLSPHSLCSGTDYPRSCSKSQYINNRESLLDFLRKYCLNQLIPNAIILDTCPHLLTSRSCRYRVKGEREAYMTVLPRPILHLMSANDRVASIGDGRLSCRDWLHLLWMRQVKRKTRTLLLLS